MKKNKKFLLTLALALFTITGFTQNIAINEDGSAPNPNAILDIKSFTKGVLIPRVSTAGRLAIPNTRGLLVYDTTSDSFWYNTGAAWQSLSTAPAAIGDSAWTIAGNSIADKTRFLGTTNNLSLFIKVNNQPAGRIEPDFPGNTFLGYKAGALHPTYPYDKQPPVGGFGHDNTAIGSLALASDSLATEGNTAVGSGTLTKDYIGGLNTAIGLFSLTENISGAENTAIGDYSLSSNTSGQANTAVGGSAGRTNVTGILNTSIGYNAGGLGTADNNNTAIGARSNVASGVTNATAIGYSASANASNKIRLGNSAVTVIEGQVPFTTPSDGRFKYHVREDVKGLDFILHLRPVTYQFDVKTFDEQQRHSSGNNDATPISRVLQASYAEASAIRRSGFIAQEVEKAADASGYNFSGIIKPKTEQEHYSLSYESFVVPLVKAVQEQQKIIVSQNHTNEVQQQQIAELQKQVAELIQLVHSNKSAK